ncbi:DUF3107 domain-containing protein [Segniliparus rugosus]|uniref:ATP-binding protein n=1 Tax=Segniliparus rugosus (strain ATCC BAA-974 / DSM 45345 / CCUG 50838 / CIP 108380 / JCM 13579 / CDC 945) TaxID=679197 RepID=E5XQ31_SEGRC|nr:DUF3107 domain-containing protein [Segniliparus rugosus]EFV13540.1 hypothetical protein HMPREF9336_01603 [Segniliparus rugosus ATCC BAA-974]
MDVKIGIVHSPRELTIDSAQSATEIAQLISSALADDSVLSLVDSKERQYLIPASRISYVEIGSSDPRRVGFSS